MIDYNFVMDEEKVEEVPDFHEAVGLEDVTNVTNVTTDPEFKSNRCVDEDGNHCSEPIEEVFTESVKKPEKVVEESDKAVEEIAEKEVTVFDLELAKSKFSPGNIDELVDLAEKFVVSSNKDAEKGLSMAMQSRKLANAIEKSRKEIVRPHISFQKAVKKYADEFHSCLKNMEKSVLKKVEAFQDEQEREQKKIHEEQMLKEKDVISKRRKEQRNYEEALKKRDVIIAERLRMEEANKTVKALRDDPIIPQHKQPLPPPLPLPVIPPPPIPPAPIPVMLPQKIKSDDGTSTTIVEWVFEIEDEMKVPREYLVIDEKLIREAVKGGCRNIEGVNVFERKRKQYRVK